MRVVISGGAGFLGRRLAGEILARARFAGPGDVAQPVTTVTVSEMIAALERAGGDAGLVDWAPDPEVARIVESWPARFDTSRARSLGFAGDKDMDAIVAARLDDTRGA